MYDLVKGLDRSKYTPIVGFHRDNFLVEKLRNDGIEVIIFPQPEPFVFKLGPLDPLLAPLKRLINIRRRFLAPAHEYAKFLRERKIDLVNLNNSITRNHAWMLAARGRHAVHHARNGNQLSYSTGCRAISARASRRSSACRTRSTTR